MSLSAALVWAIIYANFEVNFPVYLRVGGFHIHPHVFFEVVAYLVAFVLFFLLRRRHGDPISGDFRWWVIAAAVVGAALGCRLLGWLENPVGSAHLSGKTIVGGLAGGVLSVELLKKQFAITSATGDLFAIPIALGIAIGRVGCFLTGLPDDTYGNPTSLPWGINFGDGIPRHPIQVYEIVFLLSLIAFQLWFWRRPHAQGDIFKAFMIIYMAWRFLIDFTKPAVRVLGLSAIQIVCLLMLVYYAPHLIRLCKSLGMRRALAEGWPNA